MKKVLSLLVKDQIDARDLACVVCGLMESLRLYFIRVPSGDYTTADACKVCGACARGIKERKIGIAGNADTSLSITDARAELPLASTRERHE